MQTFAYECTPYFVHLYKFTGKERDQESGLDYFGARYFGSALGRFTSPDKPFADQHASQPQSWNLYTYGRNNPLRNIDVGGFKVLEAVLAQAQAQIKATAASGGKTFNMVFLGINSGAGSNGLAKPTLTGDSIGQFSNKFGLGKVDTSASGNAILIPNGNGPLSALRGAANKDQVDTANAIAPLVSQAGLQLDAISHSNGVNALGAFAAGGADIHDSVVIAPNTGSLGTLSNIAGASDFMTIISSPNDSRLAETPAHIDLPTLTSSFGDLEGISVVQTNQRGHGAQCYGAALSGKDSTSVQGCQ